MAKASPYDMMLENLMHVKNEMDLKHSKTVTIELKYDDICGLIVMAADAKKWEEHNDKNRLVIARSLP